MKKVVLYPKLPRVGQDLSHVKSQVVPNQSMTLQEIIRRFIKKEPLPQMKEGVYNEEYDYDLEKLSKADRTEQEQVIAEFKNKAAIARAEYEKSKAAPAPPKVKRVKQKDPKAEKENISPKPPKG